NLVWGVTPLFSEDIHDLAELSEYVKIEFKARGYAKPGEAVVMTGGYPIMGVGKTDFVKVLTIE
ncbi:MAG: pyruvate kinase, partial [Roseiflexaceae bacterium]|nr:pyruvate kinase [Roseiflexaceae bacterium]